MDWKDEIRGTDDSTWVHFGERRWPVRHNTSDGWERTRRPKWWYPHRPERRQYRWRHFRRYPTPTGIGCLPCYKGEPHPVWDCEDRSAWRLTLGLASTAAHQAVKRKANRSYRRSAAQALRGGHWDVIPYHSVDWIY